MACYCCVKGCKNNNHNNHNNHNTTAKHFFRFPKNDEKRRDLWSKFARKSVNKTAVICEDHFDKRFMVQKDKKLKLTSDAVPTIFFNEEGEIETIQYDGEDYFGFEADEMNKINQSLREQEILVIEATFVNEQIKLDDLKYRCRFCYESNDELIEISSFATYNINIDKLLQMLGLLMIESDFFPNSVCEECFNQVVSLDNFIVKCKSSDQLLWDEISKLKTITPAIASSTEMISENAEGEAEECIALSQPNENVNQLNDSSSHSLPISHDQKEAIGSEKGSKVMENTKAKKLKLSESAIINTSCNKFALRTYDCDICLQEFAGLKTFKSHICDIPEIKCSECGDNFKTAFALKSHKNYLHNTNESKNFCPTCKKVISGKPAIFKKHKAKCHHNRIENIQCKFCQKTFTSLHNYNVHVMFHTKKQEDKDVLLSKPKRKADVICELCGKAYTTVGDCRRHIKLKHTQITELFNCDICNKNYPSKSVLKDHFRNTHVVNEVACTFCGKIFRNKTHLKKHMVYHDENKKIHKCFICPEQPAFVNKAGLNRHQSRHSNHDDKINYTCDICINYNFHTNFQLKSHMKHVHGV